MATVTILGAGRMGTALCTPLVDRGHDVRLVGTHLDAEWIDALCATGTHPGLGVRTPAGAAYLELDDLGQALVGTEFVVIGVSAPGVRWASSALAPYLSPGIPVIMLSKGVEWDGRRLVTEPEVFAATLAKTRPDVVPPGAVSGPCLAAELARRVPTWAMVSGSSERIVRDWVDVASTDYYHVLAAADPRGNQVAAAIKNTYAIALGLAYPRATDDGRGLHPGEGFNHESAVFSQAIQEMARIVAIAGGDPKAVYGPSGVGDLLVTMHGRNHKFGTLLRAGSTWAEALAQMADSTLEGVHTLEHLRRALQALDLDRTLAPHELQLLRYLIAIISNPGMRDLPRQSFFPARFDYQRGD